MRGHFIAIMALVACAAWSAPAHAERLADIVQKAREARLAGDKVGWLTNARKAHALAPEHPELLFSLARAEAANGNADASLRHLADALRRGAGLNLAVPELAALQGDPRFKPMETQNETNLRPQGKAELHVAFDDAALAPEGITYHSASKRFFVGSLRGEIWQVGADLKPSLFVKRDAGLREVLGLKVDAARGLLWCAEGVFPDFPPSNKPKPGLGATGVAAFSLKDGAPRIKVAVDERPVAHGFNDLAVARNGDLYITDTEAQIVYRLKQGATKVEPFLAAADLTFVNGLVLSPDEKTLYVAHVEGVSAVDLATRTHRRLAIAADMTLGSIDGLAEKDGALIGVQNSPTLARIVRIHLDRSGTRVAKLDVLAARGNLELGATTGVVVGDAFYVIASAPPAPGAGPPPPTPRILRIGL